MKQNKMLNAILSVTTLAVLVGIFAYFGMEDSKSVKESLTPKMNITEFGDVNPTPEILNNISTEGVSEDNDQDEDIDSSSEEKDENSPTEAQLLKAQKYIDRNWATDTNCQQEWVDYLKLHPNALSNLSEDNKDTEKNVTLDTNPQDNTDTSEIE